MKIVFAGTPEFARIILQSLIQGGHQIELILTQPDRQAGRGMKPHASAVKQHALSCHIPIEQPVSLRFDGPYKETAKTVYERILQIKPDVMIVVAYGLILPKAFLDLPKRGCLNIHASLLPRWRGAAPIQRAIEAGDKETGISIMQMDEGLDTGAVLASEAIQIDSVINASELHDRLADLGSQLILSTLHALEQGTVKRSIQDNSQATYANKIRKDEATLDFSLSAIAIANKIRAFNPFPGCTATCHDIPIKIWKADIYDTESVTAAGQILSADKNGVVVACGKGSIKILELQKPGAKRLPVSEFIKGFSFKNAHFQ